MESVYLNDAKEFYSSHMHLDPIDRILRFFVDADFGLVLDLEHPETFISENNQMGDLYKEFGWNGNSFDVMNSFWTTWKCCLIVIVNEKYTEKCGKCYHFNDNHFPIIPYGKHLQGAHTSYPSVYLNYKHTNPNSTLLKIANDAQDTFPALLSFASHTHSIANFMPCPDKEFNSAKGCLLDVQDYLPLMIDKIQKCMEERESGKKEDQEIAFEYGNEKKPVNYGTIKSWHTWFINNREKAFLQDYYDVENGKLLKGKQLFKEQFLNHPVPETPDEVARCLNEMIRRILKRAERMYRRKTEE